jgi:hypothetical protein
MKLLGWKYCFPIILLLLFVIISCFFFLLHLFSLNKDKGIKLIEDDGKTFFMV